MASLRSAHRLALPALLLVLGACGDSEDRAPLAPANEPGLSIVAGATLLQCPTDREASVSAIVDARGGMVRVIDAAGGAHRVRFPAGAVSEPTRFTLTVPASPYVLVRVNAFDAVTGEAKSVAFPAGAQPSLAVSYKRCPPSIAARRNLQLYQVDERTHGPIDRPFGGRENNASDPRVVGQVPHFSEYAVGSPEASDSGTGTGTEAGTGTIP
jgi:hypothetical protein